ncbi:hypothetical protein LEP48_09130 [Isoptericola sp. NEAU-Y5]|uniref:Uncharacterized protein n=1 Tax=Isoptericola luteus TaxID=2879484 RepID=A0ABS7ZEN5_9MICO|nr:hypothetical protein [Isoptericola sp. NEAU-Y5]MCA5893513.1 hypothetical protein [Isoptericola sp. NEAU-Y5]
MTPPLETGRHLGRLVVYMLMGVVIIVAAPLVVVAGYVQLVRRRFVSGVLLVLVGTAVVWLAWPAYLEVLGLDGPLDDVEPAADRTGGRAG